MSKTKYSTVRTVTEDVPQKRIDRRTARDKRIGGARNRQINERQQAQRPIDQSHRAQQNHDCLAYLQLGEQRERIIISHTTAQSHERVVRGGRRVDRVVGQRAQRGRQRGRRADGEVVRHGRDEGGEVINLRV